MNTWKTYNKEKLDNTIEVKLYNNKITKPTYIALINYIVEITD